VSSGVLAATQRSCNRYFNHAQFYGPASVDGEVNDPHFGEVVSAAAPRLVQVATKFIF
jgi:hypothetical protein